MLDEIVLMAQNQQKNDLFLEILNEEVRQKIIDIFQKNNKTLDDKRYLQDILNKLQNIKDNVLNYSNASHAINNVSNVRSIAFNNTNNTIDKIEIIKKSIEAFKKNINLLENIIKEVKHSNSPIKATTYSFGDYWDYENNYIEEEWVEKYIDVQSWDNCNLEYFETLKYFSWYNQAMKSMNEWFLFLNPFTEIEINTGFPHVDGFLKLGQAIISLGQFFTQLAVDFSNKFIKDIANIAKYFSYPYTKSIVQELNKLLNKLSNESAWYDRIRIAYFIVYSSFEKIKINLNNLYLIAEKKYNDSQGTDYFGSY